MTLDEDTSLLEVTTTSRVPTTRSYRGITVLFATTAFIGAGLLFVVQPLVTKLLLPSYGGSATVWSTSSLLFQVLLLAAYWYVHWSTTRFGSPGQPRLHLPLLVVPLLALPIALPDQAAPEAATQPALWLLRTLILMVGLPFAVVATTGPVLQRWYSWSDSHRAEDPYFLFAASNLGSFGGLLAYPLMIEPNVSLDGQRVWWSLGFAMFVLLAGACAVSAARGRRASVPTRRREESTKFNSLGRGRALRWVGLAFLPSSLMLGVTAHLSTDVAAIPLLWVVPLAIYLASFVLAFNRTSRTVPVMVTRAAIAAGFVAIVTSLSYGAVPIAVLITINLVMLALVGYAAHARLAADRPPVEQLTSFYLVIAVGGASGGLLNGLIAPTVFDWVLEYPLVLGALPLLMLGIGCDRTSWLVRQLHANPVRAVIVTLAVCLVALGLRLAGSRLQAGQELYLAALVAAVLLVGWWASQHAAVMLAAVAVIYGVAMFQGTQDTLEQTRTFFGSYTVEERADRHQLVHGTTVHGTQFWDESRRRTPTTYYSKQGPLGDVFSVLDEDRFDKVAAVGLGTGTVAAYGSPGQSMTFFEIDPGMVRIAKDPRLFTYLEDSEAQIETVVGDGRLGVAESPSSSFDLMILDAFSSDSIPIHLLTREAMQVYADRLTDDGVLAVHISNRVFDLEPVLAGAAADLGWGAVIGREAGRTKAPRPVSGLC